jgi:chloramphenicol 3-O phosphotransferase
MVTGKLIVLNGGSSSGKTVIARAFQDLSPDHWLHLGIDMFWYAIPPSQVDPHQMRPEYQTWEVAVDADGREWWSLTVGPVLDRAMRARYRAIRVYLEDGMNVVADDMFLTRDWLVEFLRVFEGHSVWLVGIHVSDEEGARREAERGNRLAGTNRGSARAAHADLEYDFELDTTDIPIPELARELYEKYQACPQPGAFDQLRKRLLP